MDRIKRSPGAKAKVQKMTKEQRLLAIMKKKEFDARAAKIVEQMIEPEVEPEWLLENLKNINKCHLEDVIEERAITKVCGYVLCHKPITVVINQRYHISLKNKKVYDVTKRKNFCSSSCFGASNYLLEQMLTSPLWLRDKEDIPTFRIYSKSSLLKDSHGEEIDIAIIKPCPSEEVDNDEQIKPLSAENPVNNTKSETNNIEKEIAGNVEDFVFEQVKNININTDITVEDGSQSPSRTNIDKLDQSTEVGTVIDTCDNNQSMLDEKENIIEQLVYQEQNENSTKDDDKILQIDRHKNIEKESSATSEKNVRDTSNSDAKIEENLNCNSAISEKSSKHTKKNKRKERKDKVHMNNKEILTIENKVEQSFQQWVSEKTVFFLFEDDTIKQKTIEKIDQQDKYSILCQKLRRLQFEDEQEDAQILDKPALKPAPHIAVLREQGEKLDLKVRAFYSGETTFEVSPNPVVVEKADDDSDTFLPLLDMHNAQTIRRNIVLDKLDQVLPDLIRTLAGNNEAYIRNSYNYTSRKFTAVKALVQTFSLSAKNITFKTAEWILVGLIILKMLSLLDPWLATLLESKQANLYISMILSSYKLDANYLSLLVASFNPNMNPK